MSDGTGTTFRRPPSRFRDRVTADGSSRIRPSRAATTSTSRWACPWAHRTVIGRRLKGLEDAIPMSVVDPIRDDRGWAFTGGEYMDPVNGFGYLAEAYERTDPAYDGRISVPGPVGHADGPDRQQRVRRHPAHVHHRLRRTWPRATPTLAGTAREGSTSSTTASTRVNNAVYVAGFSTDQAVYERTVYRMFDTFDELDARLATGASCSATRPWRRTGGCSRRCCASTPSTSSTSSAACGGSPTTRTSGRTRATSTSSRCIADTVASTRSAATTTAPIGRQPARPRRRRPDSDFAAPHDRARLGERRIVRA